MARSKQSADTNNRAAGKPRSKSSVPAGEAGIEAWQWYPAGSLQHCILIREKHWVLTWDDSNKLHLLDQTGTPIFDWVSMEPLVAIAAADTGERLFAASKSGQIYVLDGQLQPKLKFPGTMNPMSLACDHFGQYLIVSDQTGVNLIFNERGRKMGEYESRWPLKFLHVVHSTGEIVGVSEHGGIASFTYRGQEIFMTGGHAGVGGTAIDGTGDVMVLACFGLGVERVDPNGKREGVYRIAGTPTRVAIDFDGSQIWVSTQEKQLFELDFSGTVRNKVTLTGVPTSLQVDPLSRYVVIGYPNAGVHCEPAATLFSGQQLVDVVPDSAERANRPAAQGKLATDPTCELRVVESAEEAETAVLETIGQSSQIAYFNAQKRLTIYGPDGDRVFESASIPGTGRGMVKNERWLAALTDQKIVAYDPNDHDTVECQLPTTEISNLEIETKFGHAVVVEACRILTRFVFPEHIIWQEKFSDPVEALAIQPADGTVAVVLEDKSLAVYSATGDSMGRFRPRKSDPMMLTWMDDGWITSGRDQRVVRGHELTGSVIWQQNLNFAPWAVFRLGPFMVVTSADGQAMALNTDGEIIAQTIEPREQCKYLLWNNKVPARAFKKNDTFLISTFEGKLLWRVSDDRPMGNFAVNSASVWIFLGKRLCHYSLIEE